MNVWVLLASILLLIICLLLFLNSIKICDGGRLIQGCGKLLFPWTKKYRFSDSKKYCCEECLKRDINLLMEEAKDQKIIFTEKEEYDGIDRTDDNSRGDVTDNINNEFSGLYVRRRKKKKS